MDFLGYLLPAPLIINPTTTYMAIFFVDVRGKIDNFSFGPLEPRKSGSRYHIFSAAAPPPLRF